MAAHMRANWARKVGLERMSLACVVANCCSRERNTASCVSRACALVERRVEPWLAYWAEVRRERSKAARPTPLRDIFAALCCGVFWECARYRLLRVKSKAAS